MPYSLQYDESVKQFLRESAGMSRVGRNKLFAELHLNLREKGDIWRAEASQRSAINSSRFVFDTLIRDEDGSYHHFRFVVDDAGAEYGVLRVVYADKLA